MAKKETTKKVELSTTQKLIESTVKTLPANIKAEVKNRLITLHNQCTKKKLDFSAMLKLKSVDIILSVKTEMQTATFVADQIKMIRAKGQNAFTAYVINVKRVRGIESATLGRFANFAAQTSESKLIDSICNEFTRVKPEKVGLYFAIVKNSKNLPYKSIRLDWNKTKKCYNATLVALNVGRLKDIRKGHERGFIEASKMKNSELLKLEASLKKSEVTVTDETAKTA